MWPAHPSQHHREEDRRARPRTDCGLRHSRPESRCRPRRFGQTDFFFRNSADIRGTITCWCRPSEPPSSNWLVVVDKARMKIELANRIRELPPYLFARIDALKNEERKKGKDLIDLGIGDPDLPTPPHIVEALAEAARDPATTATRRTSGMEDFRKAAADFMKTRFGVTVDPQQGGHLRHRLEGGDRPLPVRVRQPGRRRALPRPGLPGLRDADPLRRRRAVLPAAAPRERLPARPRRHPGRRRAAGEDPLDQLPEQPDRGAGRARASTRRWSPSRRSTTSSSPATSPTARCTTRRRRASFLETPGAREVGIEFHSLSKTYNMTGWRVGWACGNADARRRARPGEDQRRLGLLRRRPARRRSPRCRGDQALRRPAARDLPRAARRPVRRARQGRLRRARSPKASFYTLVANPKGLSSIEFAARLLTEAGVVATPATGFGAVGRGLRAPDRVRRQGAPRRGGRAAREAQALALSGDAMPRPHRHLAGRSGGDRAGDRRARAGRAAGRGRRRVTATRACWRARRRPRASPAPAAARVRAVTQLAPADEVTPGNAERRRRAGAARLPRRGDGRRAGRRGGGARDRADLEGVDRARRVRVPRAHRVPGRARRRRRVRDDAGRAVAARDRRDDARGAPGRAAPADRRRQSPRRSG